MNLANFAEDKGAEEMFFILNRFHPQKSRFDKMFKVLDAERICSADT
jgi:hypothetical protein